MTKITIYLQCSKGSNCKTRVTVLVFYMLSNNGLTFLQSLKIFHIFFKLPNGHEYMTEITIYTVKRGHNSKCRQTTVMVLIFCMLSWCLTFL